MLCGEVLDRIGKLYGIEKACRAPEGEDLSETRPLPHEVKALLAEGKLDPSDFDDHTEGILGAALAAADAVARASPIQEGAKRESGEPSSAP